MSGLFLKPNFGEFRTMFHHKGNLASRMVFAVILVDCILLPRAVAQSGAPANAPAKDGARAHYLPNHLPKRANMFYGGIWGVDSLRVKAVESGELVRFSWRVLDAEKAAALNDKKANPLLFDSRAGVQLVVPTMEKVGQLRQSSTPVAGKSYWMAFSNKGRRVKRGDRVSVVIGKFRVEGLVVE